jgi:hypothetical protein
MLKLALIRNLLQKTPIFFAKKIAIHSIAMPNFYTFVPIKTVLTLEIFIAYGASVK